MNSVKGFDLKQTRAPTNWGDLAKRYVAQAIFVAHNFGSKGKFGGRLMGRKLHQLKTISWVSSTGKYYISNRLAVIRRDNFEALTF